MPPKKTEQELMSVLDEMVRWAKANQQELRMRAGADLRNKLRQLSSSADEKKYFWFLHNHSARIQATPILAARLRDVGAVVQSDVAGEVVACAAGRGAQSSASPSRVGQDATPAKRHKSARATGGEIEPCSPGAEGLAQSCHSQAVFLKATRPQSP